MHKIILEDIMQIIEDNSDIDFTSKLKDSTFLITGANGMIGSYWVNTLLYLNEQYHLNIKIVALVRNRSKLKEEVVDSRNVLVLEQDVCDPVKLNIDQIDYIIHAASQASPKLMREDPVGTIAANTVGTYNTLELARKSSTKGYLYISSREIYGQPYNGDDILFTESTYGVVDPLDVRSCYPEGKKASETMCACYKAQYDLNTKIVRLAHTYGPGMSIYDGRVQADFLKNCVNHEDIVMKSDGSSIRTYTYISDAISAMWRVLFASQELVYNVGDEDNKTSIKQLAELLVEINQEKNIKVIRDMPISEINKGTSPISMGILDSSKIRGIGWKPKYNLRDGFLRSIKFIESSELENIN